MSINGVYRGSYQADLGDSCETPIERSFFEVYRHFCAPTVKIRPQQRIEVPIRKFRLDFLLSTDRGNVCIECDGKDYHDPAKDELRDALVLGSGLVQGVLRFPGWALKYRPADCVYTVSRYFPELFSEPGLHEIERRAHSYVCELLEPPARVIRCDIRDTAVATRFVPENQRDFERVKVARPRPFGALYHSFDHQVKGDPDFRRAYYALLLGNFETFDAAVAKFPFPGMAEADYEHRIAKLSSAKRRALHESLRRRDAEYKAKCHFFERLFYGVPMGRSPSLVA